MNEPKIIFLGTTTFSYEILSHLLKLGFKIDAVFTMPLEFDISYSEEKVTIYTFADIQELAESHNIPCRIVNSAPNQRITDFHNEIASLRPDVILVMGWYYMVPEKVRNLAKYGAWGIHASMLPDYAGGAPLVWAIIEGEKKTGVTLFRLANGVDDGDLIAQMPITIEDEDTIKEVYTKAIRCSKVMLAENLSNISSIEFRPQDKSKIKVYPQRKPSDGEIDWNWDVVRIRNFIRAQSKPYPGAFTIINGKKVTIWDADIKQIG